MENSSKAHRLELDRRSAHITGVTDVPVFSDKTVTIKLATETLTVTGQNLSVKSLDVESGSLTLSGEVTSLRYSATLTPTSFFKKLLK